MLFIVISLDGEKQIFLSNKFQHFQVKSTQNKMNSMYRDKNANLQGPHNGDGRVKNTQQTLQWIYILIDNNHFYFTVKNFTCTNFR